MSSHPAVPAPPRTRRTRGRHAPTPWRFAVALLVTGVVSLPLYLALVNVFKTNEQIIADPVAPPAPFTIGNVVHVLTSPDYDLVPTLVRTVSITASTIVLVVLLGSMFGYYLGRHDGRAQQVLSLVLLLGLAIPFQVILIPVTQVLKALHLLGTYPGLVVFNVGYYLPFAVLVFSRFVRSVPRDLDEAAAIDGAGPLRTFFQVVLPLMHPAIASVAIFVAVWVWNDFVNPLILLGPGKGTTIMTGLYRTLGQYTSDFATTFAFMFVASLPLLVLFLALQQRFIAGLTSGATKG